MFLLVKKQLIDMLHEFGLYISYDRVHDIVTALGNNVCHYYNEIGVVCPPKLIKGKFTVATFDNINRKPSSNTSSDFSMEQVSLCFKMLLVQMTHRIIILTIM